MTARTASADKRLVPTLTSADQRYRRLLALYPRRYRDAHGLVVRGTLLDSADTHGGRVPLAELAGVAVHAIRLRLRLTPDARLGRTLAVAAPLAAGSAAALALTLLVFGEWTPWLLREGNRDLGELAHLRGLSRGIGALAYLAWVLVALVALIVGGHATARIFRVGALFATVAGLVQLPVAALSGQPRAPLYVLATLAIFALVVAAAPDDPTRPVHRYANLSAGVAAILTVAISLLLVVDVKSAMGSESLFLLGPTTQLAAAIPLLATCALLGTALARRGDPIWIAAVVLCSAGWASYSIGAGSYLVENWEPALADQIPRSESLILPAWITFLAVTAAVAAILAWTRTPRTPVSPD